MIFYKPVYFTLLSNLFFCGCGTQLALSGQAREDYLKSIKAYGEYFVKPGASREEWQRDWITCGGWPSGQFSGGAPPGAYANEILAAWRQKAKVLDDCMQSKGYEHLEGYEYGKSKSK